MKQTLSYVVFLVVASSNVALGATKAGPAKTNSTEAKVSKKWFDSQECTKLEIRRLKTGTKAPTHKLQVTAVDSIKAVIRQIEKISPEGDMMRSFIADETIELEFDFGGKKKVVEIYDGRFKTPNTAFNSNAADRKLESQLHADLIATLIPELGKRMFKLQGVEFTFKDFSITFKGMTKFDYAPTSVNGQDDHFAIRDKAGKVEEVEVSSGQVPPQPQPFVVGQQKFILETFEMNGTSLYDSYFLIHK